LIGRKERVVVICTGSTAAGCGALVTCTVCEHCEEHCLSGGSGACAAASWPREKVRLAMDDLARENGLRSCERCLGLEDPARPHRRCRLKIV
jgi:hypothetical protein